MSQSSGRGHDGGGGGKRRKSYYADFKKKPKGNVLLPGSKGFILTCNSQEQSAVREAYNILNEYAEKLYGPEQLEETEENVANVEVEDDLEAELKALKNINTRKKRRFRQLYTGVKNVLFIQTEITDPCKLVLTILEDLKRTKTQKTKFLLRLIPVLDTCKPYADNLKQTVQDALDFFLAHYEFYSEGRPVGYAVQFRTRNNSKTLKKDDTFNLINEIISKKCDTWKISLDNPELIMNVDVLNNECCFGILPDYSSYKRYNLFELVKVEEPKKETLSESKDPDEKKEDSQNEAIEEKN